MALSKFETLRQVNDDLRSALIRLHPEQNDRPSTPPPEFSGILGQLRRAAECRQHLRPHCEAAARAFEFEFERESLEYRRNLERLKEFLPGVHARLLAEKSRLEAARSHVATAEAWSRASKDTF
jgi:hypothetical protein